MSVILGFRQRLLAALLLLLVVGGPALAADDLYRYQTQAGDTLVGLSEALLIRPGDWPILQSLNRIADPRAIPVGSYLLIPLALMRVQAAPARLLDFAGSVSLREPGQAATSAVLGARMPPGSEIRTGEDGQATVELADGSLVRVGPSVVAELENMEEYRDVSFFRSRLKLLQGRIEALVTHVQGGNPHFQVKTPQAILGVRGTHFRVAANPQRNTSQGEVLAGQVAIRGSRQERLAGAGFGVWVDRRGQVSSLIALPPAPDLSRLAPVQEKPLPRWELPPVAGAAAYRAQIALDPEFKQIRAEILSSTPILRFPELPDGDYLLRVRAADALGLEGPDAVHPFRLKARPEPPLPSTPAPQSRVRAAEPRFQWAANPQAASYHLQVAATAQFDSPVLDVASLQDTGHSTKLAVGDYFWRVASVRSDGDQGPFCDPIPFSLRPPPAQPEPPELSDQEMQFNWSAEPGQKFEFQMASDAQFSNLLAALQTETPKARVAKPERGGRLYIRYRATDPDGVVGPYTKPQVVDLPACVEDLTGACLDSATGRLRSIP